MTSRNQAAARDGSPVELYAHMPLLGELEVIKAIAPSPQRVLELGAGAGRITHAMIELGHEVTAVDNSTEMLDRIRGARKIESDIEDLQLDDRFGLVLLASNLINTPDPDAGIAMLMCCRRHVTASGRVLIQRLDPTWAADPTNDSIEVGSLRITTSDAVRRGDLVEATVTYEIGERVWRHPFVARRLSDEAISAMLLEAGLALEFWIDERRSWFAAGPLSD